MRYSIYLTERYQALLGYVGGILAIVGGLHLVPLLLLFVYPDELPLAGSFLLAGLPLIIGGSLCWYHLTPDKALTVKLQEGFVAVTLIWVLAIIFGAIPFIFVSHLSFSQAIFESTSGWTTTGLSVVDVTTAPKLILFFRSLLQLLGGAGLAIIALSTIAGPVGAGLSIAEGRGDLLAPHVQESIRIVLRMYIAYIVAGVIGLHLAGMSWFDAINHAFTAVATGGFSTRPESIGYWDSASIEAVIIVLMILGNINFLVAYTVLRGKLRAAARNAELRLVAVVIPLASILLFAVVTQGLYPTLEKSLRVAVFESVTALTGTGFSTVSYIPWADFGWFVLIILMVLGGGSGSTAGGIKQFRIYVMYKAIQWELKRAFMPSRTVNEPAIWHGDRSQPLSSNQVRQIAIFIGIYLIVLLLGTGMMMMYGESLADSLFEFASTLGTVGLSVGITQPDMPVGMMWGQVTGMLLGRLEFFAVIIGISKLILDGRTILQTRNTEAA